MPGLVTVAEPRRPWRRPTQRTSYEAAPGTGAQVTSSRCEPGFTTTRLGRPGGPGAVGVPRVTVAALVPASLRATTEIRYSCLPTRPPSTTGPATTFMVPRSPGRSLVHVMSYDDALAT